MKFPEYPVIDMAATGQRIRKLRQEKGIKVSEISQYMGFTEPQAVYKWQRGESLPSLDNLYALSRILGTSMEDILVGDDGMSSRHIYGINECTSGLMTAAFFYAQIKAWNEKNKQSTRKRKGGTRYEYDLDTGDGARCV